MTRLSLLFVNLHYEPDVAATGQHLADLAEYLAAVGHEVSVLCGRGHYVRGPVDAPARELRNGVRVRRLHTPAFGRRTHAHRMLTYVVFFGQVMARLLFGRRDRRVIFLTTPPLIFLAGYVARRLRGARYAIWSMDLHPDAEAAAGMLEPAGLPYQFLRGLSARAFRAADFVVDLGPFMKRRILAYGVSEDRLSTVHIWTRPDLVRPVERRDNPVAAELSLGEEIVVSYSGNAGIAHRFDEVLEAMVRLRDDERVRFLFIGDGPRRAAIESFVRDRSITGFTYLDYFPRDRLRDSLSLGDIHLVTLREEFAGIAVPGKLPGIMASGRPVLFVGPARSETAEAIRSARCGVVVDPSQDPDPVTSVVNAICHWVADPSARRMAGNRARQNAIRLYDMDSCCGGFHDLIRQRWDWPAPAELSPLPRVT